MKTFILLILLFKITLTEQVKCSCERFEQKKCEILFKYKKCLWLDNKCLNYGLYDYNKRQQEQSKDPKLNPESIYCKDLKEDLCQTTNGCAYYNQECIQFPGCSLFDINHCSQSSTKCHVYKGQCIEYTQCQYLIRDECGKRQHLNGVAESCQWKDEKCSEKECEDVPQEYFDTCNQYLNKCSHSIKNGKYVGCQRNTCKAQIGLSKLECTNIITYEGKCDKSKLGNSCYGPGDCTGEAKSQDMCEQFGDNCFFNGKECLPMSQLKSCNQYKDDCNSNIGLEGQCKMVETQNKQNIQKKCYSTDCSERFCYQTSGCVDKNECYLIFDYQKCNETIGCAYQDFHCINGTTNTKSSGGCTMYNDKEQMCTNNQECQYIPHQNLRQQCEVITSDYYCRQNEQLDYLNCIWRNNQCEVVSHCSDLKNCSLFVNCHYMEQIQKCIEQSVCEDYDIYQCQFMNNYNCKILDNQCVSMQCEDHQNENNCKINKCQFVNKQCKSKLTCESNLEKIFCTSDQDNLPCIWNEGLSPKCQQFSSCQSLQKQSIAECKSYSTHCTYQNEQMGAYCSVNRRCFKQDNQCKSETSDKCGKKFSKDNGEFDCQLFTKCIDSDGTDLAACQEWSDTCTSNGENCTTFSNKCQDYFKKSNSEQQNRASCTINAARIRCNFKDGKCQESTCTQQNAEDCSTYQLCYKSDCNQQCYLTPRHNCIGSQDTCIRKCIDFKETCDMYTKENCYKSKQNICFWNDSKRICAIIYDCFQAKYQEICDTTKCVWNEEDKYCQELSCSQIDKSNCNQTIIQGYQYTEQCFFNPNGVCVVKIPKNDVECYLMSENLIYSDEQCVRCQMPKERVNPLKRELK